MRTALHTWSHTGMPTWRVHINSKVTPNRCLEVSTHFMYYAITAITVKIGVINTYTCTKKALPLYARVSIYDTHIRASTQRSLSQHISRLTVTRTWEGRALACPTISRKSSSEVTGELRDPSQTERASLLTIITITCDSYIEHYTTINICEVLFPNQLHSITFLSACCLCWLVLASNLL